MEKSPEIKNLANALQGFQKDVENVSKDSVNPFFKSKYASLESVIETIKKPLEKNGLSFSQFPDGMGLTTILMHNSGEWIQATSQMTPKDPTPQGHGSAITYLRRYALSAILGLASEDDDDGNAASAPVAPKKAPTAFAKPPVYKSDAIKEQEAKKRIATLCDKLNGDIETKPVFSSKEDGAKHYGDIVQKLTGRSLELAPVEELELIGDELGKLFDSQE